MGREADGEDGSMDRKDGIMPVDILDIHEEIGEIKYTTQVGKGEEGEEDAEDAGADD